MAKHTGDIESVTKTWADSFNKRNPAALASLYAKDAVLWGTLSVKITSTPEGVRQYFDAACSSPLALAVVFDEQLIRACGDLMLNSGTYTFAFERDGKREHFPARFSMALRNERGRWLIVDHHSSGMPTAPAASPK